MRGARGALLVSLALILAGCGQKGALVLPQPQGPHTPTQDASAPATSNTAPPQTPAPAR